MVRFRFSVLFYTQYASRNLWYQIYIILRCAPLTFFPIVLKRQSHQEFCAGLERLLSAKFVALQRLYAPPSHGRDPRVLVNVVPKQIFNIICTQLFFMRLFSATL